MLDHYQTTGVIRDDGLEVSESRGWSDAIAAFVRGDVVITMDAATAAEVRSMRANRFMWAIFAIIAEASGHTKDEVHDLMCEMFLSYQMDVVDRRTGESETKTLARGTSKLPPKEHSEFLDLVMAWAGEFFGCEFPDREVSV